MKKLFYLFLLTALWLVVIVSCQDKVPATGIKLVERTAVLAIGGTKTLKADVIPFSATNREVIWSSSNNNIATVTNNNSAIAAYATVLVTGKAAGTATITATSKSGNYTATCVVTVVNAEPEMVLVEGGTFIMGCTDGECRSDGREEPAHQVTLSTFKVAKYPITQLQWEIVMGYNPSTHRGDDNLPVEMVSWNDVQAFIQKLNALTGKNYRLPTEAEWEYAARGGNKSKGYKYSGSDDINIVAWYNANSGGITHPVGTKAPNELGIYDMCGNVSELCSDFCGYYTAIPKTNPTGPDESMIDPYFKITRGGSIEFSQPSCRVSNRAYSWSSDWKRHTAGFRLVHP